MLLGATEHDAIRTARGGETIPVDGEGVINLDALEAALQGASALVCLMLANNETGTIQPVAAAAALCRRYGALLHVDAVQAAGRMPVDLAALGADSLAISSHKMGGPAGAGALLLAPDRVLRALITGGGQEQGRRGGTPPVAIIAGFARRVRPDCPRPQRPARRDRGGGDRRRRRRAGGARIGSATPPALPYPGWRPRPS